MLILDNTAFAIWVVLIAPVALRMSRSFLGLAASEHGGREGFDRYLRTTLLSLGPSVRQRPRLLSLLILPQKDPELERLRRQTVRSIAWLIAWLVGAWAIAYTASFYVSFDVPALRIIQIAVFAVAVVYLLGQLIGPRRNRWVPTILVGVAAGSGVVLIVLTVALAP